MAVALLRFEARSDALKGRWRETCSPLLFDASSLGSLVGRFEWLALNLQCQSGRQARKTRLTPRPSSRLSYAMEITAVPTEQRTEIPNLPAESFMTSNVIVAPAAVKGVAAGVSPATQDSSSGSAGAFSRLKTKKRSGKAGTRRKISWDEPSAAGSFYSRGWHSRWRPGVSATRASRG